MLPLSAVTEAHVERIFATNVRGVVFTVEQRQRFLHGEHHPAHVSGKNPLNVRFGNGAERQQTLTRYLRPLPTSPAGWMYCSPMPAAETCCRSAPLPFTAAVEPVKITEAPSVSSGSAFCTVNTTPRTLVVFATIADESGRLDVLFANAGGGDMLPLSAVTEAHGS
jgi:hypothetical protein